MFLNASIYCSFVVLIIKFCFLWLFFMFFYGWNLGNFQIWDEWVQVWVIFISIIHMLLHHSNVYNQCLHSWIYFPFLGEHVCSTLYRNGWSCPFFPWWVDGLDRSMWLDPNLCIHNSTQGMLWCIGTRLPFNAINDFLKLFQKNSSRVSILMHL